MGYCEFSSTSALEGVNAKAIFEIDSLVRRGEKIKAIGVYRDATGADLATAKDAIEKYITDNGIQNATKEVPKKKGWFGL